MPRRATAPRLGRRVGPKRCCIYCRVSTTRQEDNSSLDSQERACREWAEERGYVVVKVVREVHTGSEFWQRQGMQEVRELMASGEIDAVVCYEYDRLSRKIEHQGLMAGICERDGIELRIVQEPDEEDLGAKILKLVKMIVAEMEREKIRERTSRGRREKALQGRPVVGNKAPYGYRWADHEKTRLEEHAFEARWVRWIYTQIASGESLYQVSLDLNTKGVPTPSGGESWNRTTIRAIVKNPVYCARPRAFRQMLATEKRGLGRRWTVPRPEGEQIPLPAYGPALVDEVTWQLVQHKLETNKARSMRNTKNPEAALLRSGYARCADCKRALQVQPISHSRANKYRYFCVRSSEPAYSTCKHGGPAMHVDELDAIVVQHLAGMVKDPDALSRKLREMQETDPLVRDLEDIDAGLADLDRRMRSLLQGIEDVPVTARKVIYERVELFEEQTRRLQADRAALQARMANYDLVERSVEDLKGWCAEVRDRFDKLSWKELREFMDRIGLVAWLHRAGTQPRVEITWYGSQTLYTTGTSGS